MGWSDLGEDEDEQAEQLVAAYTAEKWTLKGLRALLERGGRRKKPSTKKQKWEPGVPALLKTFLLECGTRGSGLMLCPKGHRFWDAAEEDSVLFEVFAAGNGDYWVCTPGRSSEARFVDHESMGAFYGEPQPLGRLLAAWLFYDEVIARGLEEHPTIEEHALELCPVAPSYMFPDIPL